MDHCHEHEADMFPPLSDPYEPAFRQQLDVDVAAPTNEQFDWYGRRARRLEECLSALDAAKSAGTVVEIGSGPIGIVNFLDWGTRYAVDRLEHVYRTQPNLVNLRNPAVTYLDGTGERLPFESASCSLVILDNVIDRIDAPGKILEEIHRILRPGGHLYLCVSVHTRWGLVLHSLAAAHQTDTGHPCVFTSPSLRRFLHTNRFDLLLERIEDYEACKRADRDSPNLKARLRGYAGLSAFPHAVICAKADAYPYTS